MNTYARIQNGTVAELLETTSDPSLLFNPTIVWEPVNTSGVLVGWSFVNGSFVAPQPPPAVNVVTPSLSQLQSELAAIQSQITALSASTSRTGG